MGDSQKKKELRKKKQNNSSFTGFRLLWLQKRPVIFFVLGFLLLMVVFYIFWLSSLCQNHIQTKIISINVRLSSFILNLFGMRTIGTRETISSPSFSVSIARGCDAVEAMALFTSALLVFPARWNYKLAGFFAGIVILFILNIGRVISLFLTGIYFPGIFEFMHVEVWQVLFILCAIGLWIFWIKWTRKKESHAAQ